MTAPITSSNCEFYGITSSIFVQFINPLVPVLRHQLVTHRIVIARGYVVAGFFITIGIIFKGAYFYKRCIKHPWKHDFCRCLISYVCLKIPIVHRN
jgi:hypothetical protein